MARYERFTFCVNKDERRLIAVLANQLQRSQSDAVRFVVLKATRELATQADTNPPAPALENQGVSDAR